MDREKINDKLFLENEIFEGAQVAYSWNQLEPGKDEYDFKLIRADLAFLAAHHRKLWIQIQDVSFGEKYIFVPRYLLRDPQYNGGAGRQYRYQDGDEAHATPGGWMARRWDPAVQERFRKLLFALGKEFDGKIEGINLAETSCEVGETGRLFPKGFTFEIYRDGIIANLKALKRAFPKSIALQYANFMPGEWANSKGYLGAVYKAAQARVGTSEVSLAALHADEILDAGELPLRYAGISTCFRREAGAAGATRAASSASTSSTRSRCSRSSSPRESAAEHERILAIEERILAALEIPYRVVDIAVGDLGAPRRASSTARPGSRASSATAS